MKSNNIHDVTDTNEIEEKDFEKIITTIRLPKYLKEEAKRYRLNVSRIAEDALREKIESVKGTL